MAQKLEIPGGLGDGIGSREAAERPPIRATPETPSLCCQATNFNESRKTWKPSNLIW